MDAEILSNAGELLERGGPLLLTDEARHNLAFGILSTVRDHPEVYPELRGWLVHDGTRVVATALLTPPHNLVLARPLDARAIDVLAEAIEEPLPGVVAAVPEVDAFASAWARGHDLGLTIRFEQRIYALTRVTPPRDVPGAMRLAGPDDRGLVLAWVLAFGSEALHGDDDRERVERSVHARLVGPHDRGVALWQVDGEPVSLAGFGGPTPNGVRIGPVYTPPERRGHGYGSAVTAAVSQLQLDRGRRFCFLYTDLANPTSNAIYARIGYEPVCDSRELVFSPFDAG
jgi:predicted GNAT family acetyltransferase